MKSNTINDTVSDTRVEHHKAIFFAGFMELQKQLWIHRRIHERDTCAKKREKRKKNRKRKDERKQEKEKNQKKENKRE